MWQFQPRTAKGTVKLVKVSIIHSMNAKSPRLQCLHRTYICSNCNAGVRYNRSSCKGHSFTVLRILANLSIKWPTPLKLYAHKHVMASCNLWGVQSHNMTPIDFYRGLLYLHRSLITLDLTLRRRNISVLQHHTEYHSMAHGVLSAL